MGFSCKLMYVLTMPPLAKARGFTLLALIGGFLELKIGVLKHGVLQIFDLQALKCKHFKY